MDEFIKENYTFLTRFVELTALVTGLVLFKSYKNSKAKTIIYFLVYAFIVDFIGNYPQMLYDNNLFHLIEGTIIERNYWWYNIFFWCGLPLFMVYINYNVVETRRLKKIIKYSLYVYLIQVFLTLVFRFEYLFTPEERFLKISSFWIVILCIIVYFFEILRSDKIIEFYKSIYFYFNSIIFIWILIMIPMDFFESYFITDDWSYVMLKYKIYLSLNIFLYLTLTIALIFCRNETK